LHAVAERREIAIRGDMIRLGQLLKLADIVDSGGELHEFLAGEEILVNGEPETRRGRQLHPGDVVTLADSVLVITSHHG
jgi:ribosome-associated protein